MIYRDVKLKEAQNIPCRNGLLVQNDQNFLHVPLDAILNFSLEYFRKCYQWRPWHNAYCKNVSLQLMLFWSYRERNKDTDTAATWPFFSPLLASRDDEVDLKGGLPHIKRCTRGKHWHLQFVQQIAIFTCCGTFIKILEEFFNPFLLASKLK